ncbi:hypothetical protein BX616_007408, partial [Lobosporangium transversale]
MKVQYKGKTHIPPYHVLEKINRQYIGVQFLNDSQKPTTAPTSLKEISLRETPSSCKRSLGSP